MAQRRQATARRPGTIANHRSVVTKFVRFTAQFNLSFKRPDPEVICMFIEQCLQTVRSPATIRNYVSGLTSAYRQMGLDPSPFLSFKVRNALISIDNNVRHTPAPALPVSPALLKRIVRVARRLPNGESVAAAFILMFQTFYRQSNFGAATSLAFDPTRHLTRGDIRVEAGAVTVTHKWSKSHQAASHRAFTVIPAIQGSELCPKAALVRLENEVPTRHRQQPLLMFKDENHIPLSYLRKIWKTIISVLRVPHSHRYTLHSLRRGAATHIYSVDPSTRDEIKRHGLWRSNAVDTYLPKTCPTLFNVMKETL